MAGKKQRLIAWNSLAFAAVGLILLGWLLNTPAGLLGKADAVGYAVCHRIDLRSFHLGDRQLPLCTRCTGMYLGAMLGLVFQSLSASRRTGTPPRGVLVLLGALVALFVIDGLNSFFSLLPGLPHLYAPHNGLRLLTGTGMGLVVAVALFPGFNQAVWSQGDPRPALGSLHRFGLLLALALLVDVAVWDGNPLLLYPLALISAAGVLVLLTLVYSMVWVLLLRQENGYHSVRQMALPLLCGFGMALIQVALLDLGRYWLTGTWEGFHLG